ncbi:hypothetical protein EXIGLDRAFT_382420 [Exidia glandulosa HHB12029]|uniref:Uncharacterized protein n=1 Tax=Exidia glandulosa HHB12029 TaxID=1314781 RepID=A0A165BYE3_EXIGL|nr:hypothetical protein EXIGLDRAFT_382420 [Exidia glandulosa HHB12029]
MPSLQPKMSNCGHAIATCTLTELSILRISRQVVAGTLWLNIRSHIIGPTDVQLATPTFLCCPFPRLCCRARKVPTSSGRPRGLTVAPQIIPLRPIPSIDVDMTFTRWCLSVMSKTTGFSARMRAQPYENLRLYYTPVLGSRSTLSSSRAKK